MRTNKLALFLTCALTLCAASTAWSATIFVLNFDPPGVGFNDPTPTDPVGGNPGVTLGEQRLNVFQVAAAAWGAELSSNQGIYLGALFSPLDCDEFGAVLGSAGPTSVWSDFPGAPLAGTWYVGALADSLADVDFDPVGVDMVARFNGDIGVNPLCLTGQSWYNGLDHENDISSEIDLLSVVMHEMAHGLGFLELVSEGTGEEFFGVSDAYEVNLFDRTLGDTWENLTDAERLASQVNSDTLVWVGESVTADAPSVLGARPSLQILNPKSIQGSLDAQAASFGPALTGDGGTTGKMVVAVPNVACGGPLQNKVRGKIVVIDRGACSFAEKVFWAQYGGAKGAVVVNNQPTGKPPMGGSDDSITIPSVGITMADGDMIKAGLAHNSVAKLIMDSDFQAGSSPEGYVRMYAPNPVRPGSSKSHFDTSATPNLLMEPSINDDLTPILGLDLTTSLLEDIGWVLQ